MGDIQGASIIGVAFGLLLMIAILFAVDPLEDGKGLAHDELCPTILEQTHTAADSLAVFQKHEGCWEYVQRGTK